VTELVALPAWQLGLEADQLAIYDRHASLGDLDGRLPSFPARAALARRRYSEAAESLAAMAERYPEDPWVQHARLFALCMDGRGDEARALAGHVPGPRDTPFWHFMRGRCGFTDPQLERGSTPRVD
jgi:hypothetical protein